MFSTLRRDHLNRATCDRAILILLVLFTPAAFIIADAPATTRPEDILNFLDKTVSWHRQLSNHLSLVNGPGDTVFLNENRQIADQVVQLAFEFARAEAQQLTLENKPADSQSQPNTSQYQNLLNLKEKSKQRLDKVQHELDSLKQQLLMAGGQKRKMLESEVAETEDELELLKARHETLQNFLQFASGMSTGTGPKGLQAQIEELARTAPVALPEIGKGSVAGGTTAASSSPGAIWISTDSASRSFAGSFAREVRRWSRSPVVPLGNPNSNMLMV